MPKLEAWQVGDRVIVNMSKDEAKEITDFTDRAFDMWNEFGPSDEPSENFPIVRSLLQQLLQVTRQ